MDLGCACRRVSPLVLVFGFYVISDLPSDIKWKLLEIIPKFTLSTILRGLKALVSAPSCEGYELALCPVVI